MGSVSHASENSDRNTRINQCIKLLQPQDKALRNNWRGSCGEAALEAELSNSGLLPESEGRIESDENAALLEPDNDKCKGSLDYRPISFQASGFCIGHRPDDASVCQSSHEA
jgi:hypothetical protein